MFQTVCHLLWTCVYVVYHRQRSKYHGNRLPIITMSLSAVIGSIITLQWRHQAAVTSLTAGGRSRTLKDR